MNYIIVYFVYMYLSGYFLEAPREYIHPGLVLGLDWTSCQLSSTCIFFVCLGPPSILLFVPTIHVSHMHPPWTTRWLNTDTQVNNVGMLHLTYNRHTYIHHIIITIQLFPHTPYILLGRPAGPDPSCREQSTPSDTLPYLPKSCQGCCFWPPPQLKYDLPWHM